MNGKADKMELSGYKKKMTALKPVLLALFSFLLVMNLANLLFVIIYSSSKFFGSTLFSHISIYSSRLFFICHNIASIITCALVLYLTIKKTESRILLIVLLFYLFLFLYPLLAN
jgi:hypothetical protein